MKKANWKTTEDITTEPLTINGRTFHVHTIPMNWIPAAAFDTANNGSEEKAAQLQARARRARELENKK